jgi:NAD(P)-dependent dehydrogenase (short-subunit alcohol dehydrogenase family)
VRRFEQKSVIVTGAGRGIGQATAERFASEGADVTLIGRSSGPLEEVAAGIRAAGGLATPHACDVRSGDDADAAVAAVVARTGRVDVLVNNAGIDDDTPFLDIDRDRWLDVVATNLTGPFLMSQAAARAMRDAGGGVILHNISIDASGGDGTFASYNASKAALLGLNRTMALELAPHGIRVNGVSPGFTHTAMTEKAVGPKLMAYLNGSFDRVPLRRLVKPTEVANAFVFLASDEASGITGHNLTVDCGLTANWYILESLPGDDA